MSSPHIVVNGLLQALKANTPTERCLYLKISNFGQAPDRIDGFQALKGFGWEASIGNSDTFDFIFANLPLGMNRVEHNIGDASFKVRRNWIELHKTLNYLSEDGIALFLVGPSAFSLNEGVKFLEAVNNQGFHLSAIYRAPENLLQPETGITPVLVQISRAECESIFVGELNTPEQVARLIENRARGRISKTPTEGMELVGAFHSFDRINTELQLQALETQYKKYKRHPLSDLLTEINSVQNGDKFEEVANSIYIQKMGGFRVECAAERVQGKHHNYYQVGLKPHVSAEYLACFLASEMGKLSLRSIARGSIASNLTKVTLSDLFVSVPGPEDQETIAATSNRLKELRGAIDGLGGEFALNPMGSEQFLLQIEAMLDAIGGLSEADQVLSLCRSGECAEAEFKETLSLDVRKGTREKYIELSSLKTVAAFLNTHGGTLLVGVNDSGEISGIDVEISNFFKNPDKFLLHFKNLLKSKIGEEYYPFVSYGFVSVQGLLVLKVVCEPAKSPCYLAGKEFYVRTNPATDKLEGPKLVEYVKNHFS